MTTKLVIGCPTFERAWALPLWFDSIEAQNLPVDEINFCFAYSKSYDGTFDILENRASKIGNEVRIYQFDLTTYSDRNLNRIPMLAQIRNALLEMVRETDADYYLSWDDDILFPPNSVHHLFDTAIPSPAKELAVGALIDMGGNDKAMAHPSLMHFPQAPGEIAYRKPFNEYDWNNGPFEAEVIMAVKLMGKEVYENTQYAWDPTGEDIGWSFDASKKGYKRFIHPEVRGIHLYHKETTVDILKTFPKIDYPEILGPLSRWYTPKEQWTTDSWA